uniref:RNase H type-1 domain-containing protein n=1 Tax=Chenopodium quinoa TaxID=63459 RepID=A0A803KQ76_CHEQI
MGFLPRRVCVFRASLINADVAEALAARHTLSVTLDSGFSRVCIETECLKLYSHLSKHRVPPTELGSIVSDILQLARGCLSCSFSFVKRSGNRVAHELAKLCSSFESLRVWMEEVPYGVSELYRLI